MRKPPQVLTCTPCGATETLVYWGSVGQCTITIERHGYDDEGIARYGGVIDKLNFGYPVKACGHCEQLNIDVPGFKGGWNGRNPIRGEYCSESCRYAAKMARWRASHPQYAGFRAPS